MNTSKRYSPEVRERTVRMVLEYEEEFNGHHTPHEGKAVLT